jgi:hypothetical protein
MISKYLCICLFFNIAFLAFSQNLETIKDAKPFAYHGTIQSSLGGYAVKGIENRRNPYSWSLSGTPTFSIYEIDIPFSFVISEQNRNFRQPFNQFGLSPKWKWITVHGGFRNLNYSNYTLNGHTFLGIGVDLNPKWFRFGAMYGRFQKAVEEDTTDIAINKSQYTYAAYKRKGFATKVGFGNKKNYVDIIFTKIWDDSTTLNNKPQKQKIYPGSNATIGLVTETNFLKHFTWKLDGAISALTKDVSSLDYSLEDVPMKGLINFLVPSKISTYASYAIESSLKYTSKPLTITAKYQRIAPDYISFGTYYLQSDLERITISPNVKLLKNKLGISGSFGWQHDNLNKKKLTSTKRILGAANINYNPNKKFGISLNYSNFGTSQSAGTKSLNDTNKIDQISHSLMLMPRITLMKDDRLMHNIILTSSFQNLNDRNKINSTNYEMKTINANTQYMVGFLKKKLNINAGLNTNYTIVKAGNSLSYGVSSGVNYTFAKDKLVLSEQFTWNKNAFNKKSNGSTFQNTTNLNYKVANHHSLGCNIVLLNNKAIDMTINPSFTEFTGTITYSLSY